MASFVRQVRAELAVRRGDPMTTKLRGPTHMMEDGSFALIRERIPREWIVRPYHPDYGIDLAIELFEPLPERPGYAFTLGEWIFPQVKSMGKLERTPIE